MAEPQSDLGVVLRREAERHLPDGDAMFDRINRSRFAPEPVRASRPFLGFTGLRPVAAAASVVGVLVAGFTGIRVLTSEEPKRAPAATSGTASAAPSTTAPLPPLPSRTSAKPKHTGGGGSTPSRTHTGPSSAPPSYQPVSGFLRSTGAINAYSTATWAQSDVTVTTSAAITALDLAISVDRTAGVTNTGSWSTIPAAMITITVTEEKDTLIYRFTLKPGGTLAPGDYVFAAQYEHAAGKRDVSADLYGAICSAGDQKAEVTGAFTAG
ncbi:hypothetical protein [Actinoplanes sp. L3-i22]|uniref:hypothetical protein n=1 Tax=Actinoplanes sp. L3-i22 TaxID=2836373 RepID=UPI001C74522C|nr:hypothetical protein [Actinoplanes sp. L3-i22]BCY05969.1 hypothetical protein L3i22_010570 [Actinoplanes sp. L3-i22]